MRIIVMSDSHGDLFAVKEIIEKNISADVFLHLGDGEREYSLLSQSFSEKFPSKIFRFVKGNCDLASSFNTSIVLKLNEKHTVFMTHGHEFSVKYSLALLKSTARENNADILLFGHTHQRYQNYEDGLYIMNPGSCSRPRDGKGPSYGFVDITPSGTITNIVDL